jgi:hypothetical protein
MHILPNQFVDPESLNRECAGACMKTEQQHQPRREQDQSAGQKASLEKKIQFTPSHGALLSFGRRVGVRQAAAARPLTKLSKRSVGRLFFRAKRLLDQAKLGRRPSAPDIEGGAIGGKNRQSACGGRQPI